MLEEKRRNLGMFVGTDLGRAVAGGEQWAKNTIERIIPLFYHHYTIIRFAYYYIG